MNEAEKERLIKKDIVSIENRVRHAFNQGYEMGMKESRSEIPNTCGDAISREEALQALCKAVHKNDDTIPCSNQRVSCLWNKTKVQDYAEEILNLPSVTPQQRTGRWKFTVYDANRIGHYECSECHWNVLMNVSNYCPHCGARMEVEE